MASKIKQLFRSVGLARRVVSQDPTGADADDFGGANGRWKLVTTGYVAMAGDRLMVDTSFAPASITLPASPAGGDRISFADYGNSFGTNSLTVLRNGSKIEGATEDLTIDWWGTYTLEYIDASKGWAVV